MKLKGPTHAGRRAVGLTEGIENHRQLILGDTNTGVGHAELKDDVLFVHCEKSAAESNVAFRGSFGRCEFDGVAHQVGDDLPETQWIADELVGDVGVDVVCEVQLILRSAND